MLDLVSVGAVNADLLIYTREFPKAGQEIAVEKVELHGGGSGANVAVGLSRLGKKTGFVGKVGTDYFGRFLINEFEKENVDISNLKIEEGNSGLVIGIVDRNAERTLLVNEGLQSTLSKKDIPKDYIQSAKFLFIHSVIGEDVIEPLEIATKYAAEAGVKVLFDPGFIFAEMGIERFRKILENTSILKLNEEETKVFTSSQNIEDSFKVINDYGPQFIISTLGKEGCIVNFENEITKISVPIDLQAIDTTGAGDAFSAALVSSLIDGQSYREACKFACMVGRVSTTKVGARSVPTLEELNQFKI